MNLIDILLICAFGAALFWGWLRGFLLLAADGVGMAAGLIGGFLLAPYVAELFPLDPPGWRQFAVILVLSTTLALGPALAFMLTLPLWRQTIGRSEGLRVLDQAVGAVAGLCVAFVAAWLFMVSFDRGPSEDLSREIHQSSILRRLDEVSPQAPMLITRVEDLLSSSFGPGFFIGLEPNLPSDIAPNDANVDVPAIRTAAASVVRISGRGCGGAITGSGFVVLPQVVVTNAHVVAGVSNLTVLAPDGSRKSATVRAFDAERDLAVLVVNGLAVTPLTFVDPERGSQGAVIGYPGGGPERIVTSAVNGVISARGRDIFNETTVSRQVVVLQAEVRPGNSGGPVVDSSGNVVGVVASTSLSKPGQAFAIAPSEVQPVLDAAANNAPIDPRIKQCVRE